MAFLWGSTAQVDFDALLDKTTSDLLPSSAAPDLVASLELADLIRSSAIPPLAATKSLLRRLTNSNPNVQLLALSVFDIAIKNGGTPFLAQVAGKECATELESLARGKPDGNRDVKERALSRLQDWATAFMGKEGLRSSELVKSYERMKSEGLPFPPRDPTATAAMVDSLSAPEWTDSPYCTRCRTDFSTFNRKHHCRNCGHVFDQACSAQSAPLPHYGVAEPVRVCDGCVKKLKEGKGAIGRSRSASLGGIGTDRPGLPERSSTMSYGKRPHTHRTSSSTSALKSTSGKRSKEDEDLQRAIAASLLDAAPSSSTSGPAYQLRDPPSGVRYTSSYSRPAPPPSVSKPVAEEEEDPDLAAAIAASLRDLAPAPSAPSKSYASLYPSSSNAHYPSAAPPPRFAPLPSYDLSPSESSSLETFSSRVLEGPKEHMGERERELYERARMAQPRLERGLEDAARRREILVEMNEKLGEATRLYEGMLEDRVRGSSERVAGYSYGANARSQQQQQQPYYTASPPPQHAQEPYPPTSYAPPPQHSYTPQPYPPTSYAPYPAHTNSYASTPAPPAHSDSYAPPLTSYAPPPTSYAPSHSESLPPQSYAAPQPYAPAPQYAPAPATHAEPPSQHAGYYKPSSFPAVPTGPQAVLFPSVPTENPWEREEMERRKEEEAKVGELIEL